MGQNNRLQVCTYVRNEVGVVGEERSSRMLSSPGRGIVSLGASYKGWASRLGQVGEMNCKLRCDKSKFPPKMQRGKRTAAWRSHILKSTRGMGGWSFRLIC